MTSRTWESRPLFACQILIEALLHYRDRGVYYLHAFVVMPEHIHLLLTPAADTALGSAVQYIKGGSARRMGEELKLRFPVWQREFSDHRICDAGDYGGHLRYIEENPVKKRLVSLTDDYPLSSASRQFQLDELPQGLKPLRGHQFNGTAEAVPLTGMAWKRLSR